MKTLHNIKLLIIACFLVFLYQACTQYDTPPAMEGDVPESGGGPWSVKRRVLWINIDGAVGEIVKNNTPPNISAILPYSKYSWYGMGDTRTSNIINAEDPTSWSTMLFGVSNGKHLIKDDSYTPDIIIDPTETNQTVNYYSTIIGYIAEAYPGAKTLCITPWEKLNENLLNSAFKTITTTSDENTKNILADKLENEDYTFSLVSFKSMLEAGKSGGFSPSNSAYITALNTIDGYIGELMETIKLRQNYEDEDWLIVITSNHGGSTSGQVGTIDEHEMNTFYIFHYRGYSPVEFRGDTFYSDNFTDKNRIATLEDATNFYAGRKTRDQLTVEMVVRLQPSTDGTYQYPSGTKRIITGPDWYMVRDKITTRFYFRDTDGNGANTNFHLTYSGTAWDDNNWHTLVMTFDFDRLNATDNSAARFYIDGKMVASTKGGDAAPGTAHFTDGIIQIGKSVANVDWTQLRIWDIALPEKHIMDNPCLLDLDDSNLYYNNLIGYWKIEKGDNSLKNKIAGKPDFEVTKALSPVLTANTLPCYRGIGSSASLENVAVLPQILYWLNINNSGLDGFEFLSNFSTEEEWREME